MPQIPFNPLMSISPIDGRYAQQTLILQDYFSEYALIKYRLRVEVLYFILLSDLSLFNIPKDKKLLIEKIVDNFSLQDAETIKKTEAITNHDVKAVEYFLKEQLVKIGLGDYKEWVHFGLTSQDINNTAIPWLWKDYIMNVYLNSIDKVRAKLLELGLTWQQVPMLARTHGQPATPTTVGKEIMVFVERIDNQRHLLQQIPFSAKFGGASGNFNAHAITYPNISWIAVANEFIDKKLGLKRLQFTTQIEHYDNLSAQFDNLKRINTILIDVCRDIWTYISMEYFGQKIVAGEVGSSAMPHKVNPIDFENAEGNLGFANSIFEYLSSKLPISRLQRDLTDSTVLRNIGVPMGHTLIAFKSIEKGLQKLVLQEHKLVADLSNNWAVVAEALQNILRRENYPNPYETLKDLTRGNRQISEEQIKKFINGLDISEKIKNEMLQVTPFNYIGIYPKGKSASMTK
ncbi:MAG: adenylosuccinate lyase [Phycisphaerales bacterium]|nr:adenylosuccinate lyase [Phycisphaerales bacterium]